MQRSPLLLFLLLIPTIFFAQADTLNPTKTNFFKKNIFPSTLILAGSLLSGKQMEINFRDNVMAKIGANDQFPIDNYLQIAPIGELYLADLLGVKAKNHWFDQSKNLFMSVALNEIIITSLKYAINKTRPNGQHHSFPSGHTSFAFANATVLYEEFRETSPVLAYSGYGFAAATGAFRVLNNKHWLSDIVAGAGIGILSAKTIYHFKPLKNWNPFKKKQNLTITPSFGNGYYLAQARIIF